MPIPEPMQYNGTLITRFNLILGSASPRRKELMEQLGLEFTQQPVAVNEVFPEHLRGPAIPLYLAKLKADAYANSLTQSELLITADTVVWHKGQLLGKPAHRESAEAMLAALSGNWHEVITAVCCTTRLEQQLLHETTRVKFCKLSSADIRYYVDQYKPYDKAGGYGIQEWIGLAGISEIRGSYTNVVGMPTHLLFGILRSMGCFEVEE